MPADTTETPHMSMFMANTLRKLIPKAPPLKAEKLSWGDKVILSPYVLKLLEEGVLETTKEGINNVKNFTKGLEYMNPINYEGLANEATNRYISNHKR